MSDGLTDSLEQSPMKKLMIVDTEHMKRLEEVVWEPLCAYRHLPR